MKLRVLAGAKQGTEIPLKKSKFIIGRASDCTLRAGSDAISRHHCVLLRRDEGVSVRDLGSRNGTYVNDELIEGDKLLVNGDKVRVGPLEFVFEGAVDLARDKKPKIKDVAEALERTAEKAEKSESGGIEEDDISRWLLGPVVDQPGADNEAALRETQSFKMDDTRAMLDAAAAGISDGQTISEEDLLKEIEAAEAAAEEGAEESEAKGGKKKPGKLPKLPPKPQSKDSREAAADILRELARRR